MTEGGWLAKVIGTDTHPNHRLVRGRERFEVASVAGVFAQTPGRLVR